MTEQMSSICSSDTFIDAEPVALPVAVVPVPAMPVLPVAALASVLIAAAAVAWRWQRVAGAPHAFPVGRFA